MARRLGRLQPGDGSVLEGAPRGGEENWSYSCWCLSICMSWIGAHLIWLLDGNLVVVLVLLLLAVLCSWRIKADESIRAAATGVSWRWRRVGRHRRIGGGCARPSPATWSDINLVIKEEALHWSPAGFLLPDNTLGYACIQASQLSLFARVFLKVCNESFFGSEKKNWGQSKIRRRRRPTHSNHQHLQQSIANCNYYNRSHIFY